MSVRRPLTEDSQAELKAALEKARSKDEFRRALCVWMRVGLGLRAEQVAAAVGWSPSYVQALKSNYLRKGVAAFEGPGRGGRRRNVLSVPQEIKLLRRLRDESWPNSVLDFRAIQQAVEKEAGRPLNPSIVQRMLARHGWARGAWVAIPKSFLPASVARQQAEQRQLAQDTESARPSGEPSTKTRKRGSGVWYPARDAAGDESVELAGPGGELSSQGASAGSAAAWGRWLRELRAADGPQVAEFVRRHWRTDKIVIHGQVFSPAELPGVGAFDGETLVGLVSYNMNIQNAELEIVTFASDRPGKGLGSQLLASMVDLSRRTRMRRVWLITTNDNLNALRFYQRRGFRLVALRRGAVDESRRIKPEISLVGEYGIPIHDELELEMTLT